MWQQSNLRSWNEDRSDRRERSRRNVPEQGCIPAKAMIHASTLYREIKEADRFGISASDVTYDFEKILEYKEQTTGQLVQGVEQLLQANGVTRYYGKGTLLRGKS